MSAPIYMDNQATTRIDPRVLAVMWPWFSERWGNAASIGHGPGQAAAAAVATARAQIAAALHCQPTEIYFTSGATEANNLALKGVLAAGGRDAHLIVNAAEHRSILDPARRLKRSGHPVTVLAVDRDAAVDPAAVADAMRPATRLVSVMMANNEVGTLNPLIDVAQLCQARGIPFHSDAAQAMGQVPLDLSRLPVDLLSFTAHKFYGPQGVGALFARRREPALPLTPQIDGGGQERGLRSGTLPVALIVGFGEACRLAVAEQSAAAARLAALRDRLWRGLAQRIPGLIMNGPRERRLPGNLNVSIPGVDGTALLTRLAATELAVSSGSACSSANPEPSHVLRAMGIDAGLARASLRFGLGRFNSEIEIDRAVEIVADQVGRLSP